MCIKETENLIQVIIAELCPLKRHTCSPFVSTLTTSYIDRFLCTTTVILGMMKALTSLHFRLVGSWSQLQVLEEKKQQNIVIVLALLFMDGL